MALGMALAAFLAAGGPMASPQDRRSLIDRHRDKGLTCGSCHAEQPPRLKPADSVCARCHGDQARLAILTSKASPNPHASPHLSPGETLACGDCHHVHRPSEVSCTTCHQDFDFDVK